VRQALARLEEEGLLQSLPNGGFAVKAFSEDDIRDAIEVRGTLEGLAARLAAERGVDPQRMAQARDCVAQIDALLAEPALSAESFAGYVALNGHFHALLIDMAASPVLRRQLERATTLPFASPNGFVLANATGRKARDGLVLAQAHHKAVIEAIFRREGARAEALMREHARLAHENLREALQSQKRLAKVMGAGLIKRAADESRLHLIRDQENNA
jgi:GntR family transcriptional regulator, vanillate catabolism transcriptional regulator